MKYIPQGQTHCWWAFISVIIQKSISCFFTVTVCENDIVLTCVFLFKLLCLTQFKIITSSAYCFYKILIRHTYDNYK